MEDRASDPPAGCSCKVGTVAAAFDLDGVYEEFRREWAADDGASVRELADLFNKRVLRAAFRRAGRLPIDGEIDNVYRVLTDDETDAGSRTRAREQLRQDGISVDDVEDRFVSHQTLYRHLVDCLDASYDPAEKTDAERVADWRERLLALQNRTAGVTERGIDQLRSNGALDAGTVDVMVDVNVLCEDCGGFYTVAEFFEDGGCECPSPGDRS
jgi:hypothetical protein